MESLAIFVGFILLAIYLSTFIAFGLSFINNKVVRIIVYVLSSFSFGMGIFLISALQNFNGIVVGGIPIVISILSTVNSIRARNRGKAKEESSKRTS
jgi:hypothetical protein